MADSNSFSLTKIRMTPRTAKAYCVASAVLLVAMLAVCAFVVPESSHSHGGHGSSESVTDDAGFDYSDTSEDLEASETQDDTVVEDEEESVTEEPAVTAERSR